MSVYMFYTLKTQIYIAYVGCHTSVMKTGVSNSVFSWNSSFHSRYQPLDAHAQIKTNRNSRGHSNKFQMKLRQSYFIQLTNYWLSNRFRSINS